MADLQPDKFISYSTPCNKSSWFYQQYLEATGKESSAPPPEYATLAEQFIPYFDRYKLCEYESPDNQFALKVEFHISHFLTHVQRVRPALIIHITNNGKQRGPFVYQVRKPITGLGQPLYLTYHREDGILDSFKKLGETGSGSMSCEDMWTCLKQYKTGMEGRYSRKNKTHVWNVTDLETVVSTIDVNKIYQQTKQEIINGLSLTEEQMRGEYPLTNDNLRHL